MKLTTFCLGAFFIASCALGAKAADLHLDADLPLAEASSNSVISFDLSFSGAPETMDLEKAYTAALKYQREARQARVRLLVRQTQEAKIAEANLAVADKSLVEREEEKLNHRFGHARGQPRD